MPAPENRMYSMSDGDLIQRADLLEISITRDAVDFADRGVDAPRVAIMTDARAAFAAYPTDALLQGQAIDKRIIKDNARTALLVSLRKIRSMADTKYNGQGLYTTFGFKDMDDKSDNDLVRLATGVVMAANTMLDDLVTEGLTAEKITALEALNTAFDTAVDLHRKAIQTRDISTQNRVTLGNNLYKPMVELANIGKSIYQDSDEARYNDYVINDSPSSSSTTYTGVVDPTSTKTIATVPYSPSKEIELQNTGSTTLTFSLRVVADATGGTPVELAAGGTQSLTMGELNDNPSATILVAENATEMAGGYKVVVG